MKLVAYLRVSTGKQVDGYGLDVQEHDVRALVKAGAHKLIRIETDPGLTGTLPDTERPALLACLKAVRDGEAEGIAVPSLNRLARLLHVQEAILAQVWKFGGSVFTADAGEVLADDPDDPMRTAMRQMMGVFAQLDRAMLVKRMRNGRAEKARQGGYAYGAPRFGWRTEDHELVPDEREQTALRAMREMRADGESYRLIAEAMNAEGVRPKRGERWHPQTVARALDQRPANSQGES